MQKYFDFASNDAMRVTASLAGGVDVFAGWMPHVSGAAKSIAAGAIKVPNLRPVHRKQDQSPCAGLHNAFGVESVDEINCACSIDECSLMRVKY